MDFHISHSSILLLPFVFFPIRASVQVIPDHFFIILSTRSELSPRFWFLTNFVSSPILSGHFDFSVHDPLTTVLFFLPFSNWFDLVTYCFILFVWQCHLLFEKKVKIFTLYLNISNFYLISTEKYELGAFNV